MTPQLAIVNWYMVLLYPKGQPLRDLQVKADITLPKGWKLGTALPIDAVKDGRTQFKTVSLEMLADSPALCGKHLKEVPLGPADGPPHYLVLACDSTAGLELAPELKSQYERLVLEAGALFGVRHYRSYRFLVAMSDHINHFAVEHHECSDNRLPEKFLIDDAYRKTWHAWVLPHEYVHSWNGKYRRPEGVVTPDYQQPLKTKMLWVYEGLTQYLGFVLTGRCGLHTADVSRENYALIADWAKNQRGREWRSLTDTAVAAPHLYYAARRLGQPAARRRFLRRRRTPLARCRYPHSRKERRQEKPRSLLPGLLRRQRRRAGGESLQIRRNRGDAERRRAARLANVSGSPHSRHRRRWPDGRHYAQRLEGRLSRQGRRLCSRPHDADEAGTNAACSIGLLATDAGRVLDVIPGKAADKVGIGPGMKVIAVNDRKFTAERFRDAIAATAKGQKMRLLIENQEYFRTVTLNYADGDRYPHLERDAGKAICLPKSSANGPRSRTE